MRATFFFTIFLLLGILTSCVTDSRRTYTLRTEVTPEEGGTITPPTDEFEAGEIIEITAIPSEGWRFVDWEGDLDGPRNPYEYIIYESITAVARFERREYPLNISIEGEGTVQEKIVQTKATEDYPTGTVVELTANPATGWRFIRWEGDLDGNENPQTVTIEGETSVTAVFERREYPLEISIEGQGAVDEEVIQAAKDNDYEFGSVIRLTANPAQGWFFSAWEGDITGNENPTDLLIDEEKSVTAVFLQTTGTLEVRTVTTGDDPDPSGYVVTLDGGDSLAVGPNHVVTYEDLETGTYQVELGEIPPHCSVGGDNPVQTDITGEGLFSVEFIIECGRVLRNQILFTRENPAGSGNTDLYAMNPDGSGLTPLIENNNEQIRHPDVSRDGTKIVFQSNRHSNSGNNFDIFTANADGSQITNLTNNANYSDYTPSWSPDGSKIAFSSDRSGTRNIYVMNVDGSGVIQLTDNPAVNDYEPAWSPNGEQILFASNRDGTRNIFLIPSGGGSATNVTVNAAVDDFYPTWSPDGEAIVFSRRLTDGSSHTCEPPRNCNTYIKNLSQSSSQNITNNPAFNEYHPSWSPDGTKIVLVSNREGSNNIFSVNPDGTGMINLSNDPDEVDGHPVWSPAAVD